MLAVSIVMIVVHAVDQYSRSLKVSRTCSNLGSSDCVWEALDRDEIAISGVGNSICEAVAQWPAMAASPSTPTAGASDTFAATVQEWGAQHDEPFRDWAKTVYRVDPKADLKTCTICGGKVQSLADHLLSKKTLHQAVANADYGAPVQTKTSRPRGCK